MTDTPQREPATVVVTQPVKRGHDQEVRRWQETVNVAVGAFTGYLGNDIASGNDDEWTVIYRFDSKPHLVKWLDSPERAEVLSRGAHLFNGPANQHVLIRDNEAAMVTVVVSHPVDPADQKEFLAWQDRVTDAERHFPGFRGAELYRPVPGVQDEWTALYRYDSDEHASAWLESEERKQLLREGGRFSEFALQRISSPFGSWFAPPDRDEEQAGPPNWKTGLSVLVGLYPTVVVLTLAISEIWPGGPLWATLLIGNVCSVSLLTWLVMPVVTRALRFWLVPGRRASGARLDFTGAAVSIGFLTVAALVSWLCTTRIWHLPLGVLERPLVAPLPGPGRDGARPAPAGSRWSCGLRAQVQRRVHPPAAAGAGPGGDLPAEHRRAFAHAGDAVPGRRPGAGVQRAGGGLDQGHPGDDRENDEGRAAPPHKHGYHHQDQDQRQRVVVAGRPGDWRQGQRQHDPGHHREHAWLNLWADTCGPPARAA